MVAITGNTYHVRNELRAMGCKWDGQAKLWYAPPHVAAAAQKLVKNRKRTSVPIRSNRRFASYRYTC